MGFGCFSWFLTGKIVFKLVIRIVVYRNYGGFLKVAIALSQKFRKKQRSFFAPTSRKFKTSGKLSREVTIGPKHQLLRQTFVVRILTPQIIAKNLSRQLPGSLKLSGS